MIVNKKVVKRMIVNKKVVKVLKPIYMYIDDIMLLACAKTMNNYCDRPTKLSFKATLDKDKAEEKYQKFQNPLFFFFLVFFF
jgi:hypothetical protein